MSSLGSLLSCFALVMLTGCGISAGTAAPAAAPAPAGPVGTWELIAIDGAKLPVVPSDPDRPADAPRPPEVVAGRLVVNSAGTFTHTMQFRLPSNNQVMARDQAGSWRREGSGFVFQWEGAGSTAGTIAGDTLTYDNAGMKLAYLRAR